MRFTQHLSSHLTPEWRKYYINYETLKKLIYEMVGQSEPGGEGEEDEAPPITLTVNHTLQDKFFEYISHELQKVISFYRAREADLMNQLREFEEQVEVIDSLRNNRRTRSLRATKRKHSNLKLVLSEFYLNLVLLQYYQQLNHTGFRKALKKHDKLAKSDQGKHFFKQSVCKAYFWESKKISEMIEQTERLMIEKLEDGNRSRAMNRLRVPPLESSGRSSPWVAFKSGYFMGMMLVALLVVVVAFALRPLNSWDHVQPTVRGLRIGMILSLWFYGFAVNMQVWRKAGVNSVLIFAVDPREHLKYVDMFEIASLIGVIFLLGAALTMFSFFLNYPEWVGPLVMFSLILVLFAVPLPLLKYRSRIWLMKEIGRIFLAPFFPVTFADFWIADQMNSLAVVFLDIEFFVCYMIYGLHFPDLSIQCGSVTYGLRPIVAVLPAWFRFAQCLRRYYDTRAAFPHLVNAGKYSTSFFVVFFSSLATGLRENYPAGYYVAFVLWIVSAIVNTCYTFTWDIKMDWGLFEGKYKLRSELIYGHKVYYVLAVIEDLIFRSLWTLNFSVGEAGAQFLQGDILGTVLAVMEVFRRFVWNFFRLENEHLNNVGEFRAVRDIAVVPLDIGALADDEEEEGGDRAAVPRMKVRRISDALMELTSKATGFQMASKATGFRNRRFNARSPSPDGKPDESGSRRGSNVTEMTVLNDGRSFGGLTIASPLHEEDLEEEVEFEEIIHEINREEGEVPITLTVRASIHDDKDD